MSTSPRLQNTSSRCDGSDGGATRHTHLWNPWDSTITCRYIQHGAVMRCQRTENSRDEAALNAMWFVILNQWSHCHHLSNDGCYEHPRYGP